MNMNTKKLLLNVGGGTFATAAVIAGLWSGNLAQADDLHASVNITVAPNTFDAQDNYVYYPAYHVYYSKHHHRYAYIKGNAWVTAPTPPDISVAALQATPSVDMDFHDSPARHHAEIMRKYPKDWTSHRDR
jgi:hypothetical protein